MHVVARQGTVQSELLILVLSNESDWVHPWLTIVDPMYRNGPIGAAAEFGGKPPAKQLIPHGRSFKMTNNFVGNVPQGSAPTSMKAWRVHEFGSPEAVSLEALPRPDPGQREVLVTRS